MVVAIGMFVNSPKPTHIEQHTHTHTSRHIARYGLIFGDDMMTWRQSGATAKWNGMCFVCRRPQQYKSREVLVRGKFGFSRTSLVARQWTRDREEDRE